MDSIQKVIVKKMAEGYSQVATVRYLKKEGSTPNSVSSIEKQIKKLRKEFEAQSIVHLFVKLTKEGYFDA